MKSRRLQKESSSLPEKKDLPQETPSSSEQLPQEFLQKIEFLGSTEEKLEYALFFMQKALQEGGGHKFREFWAARKICTDLFTQSIHPLMRTRLWAQYTDLCREARVLKNIFDEQSSFLAEQIEKAIEVVESELPVFHEKGTHLPPVPEFAASFATQKHVGKYESLYHELKYLNSFASRIGSLRKELLKTEMRMKQKHRLLDRLAKLGDSVYPKRKQAISEVSALFLADIEAFLQEYALEGLKTTALFDAREEIKKLQEVAKMLTLGTDAFSKVRESLSQFWDRIKDILKERKKVETERRELSKTHREELLQEPAKKDESFRQAQFQSFMERVKQSFSSEEAFFSLGREAKDLSLPRTERLVVERELARLREEGVASCLEQADALERLLANCRQAIDMLRKETSGSTSDFTLAMQYTDLLEKERNLVLRIEEALEKLEQ